MPGVLAWRRIARANHGRDFEEASMPRSITRPQKGSIVWYFATPTSVANAALVTKFIDEQHFNLAVWDESGVVSQAAGVRFVEAGQGVTLSVTAAAVAAGGAGYVVNEVLTLPNGVGLKVLTVSTGAVATVAVVNGGNVLVAPANPQAQILSTGAGTGATFNLTWGTAPWCTYIRVNEFIGGSAANPAEATMVEEHSLTEEQRVERRARIKEEQEALLEQGLKGPQAEGGNNNNEEEEEDEEDVSGAVREGRARRTAPHVANRRHR
jgi:hypothetical protein